MTDVLTYHNDNGRTGQTLHEEILRPGNVTNTHFGLLRALPTDGRVDAQPLYAAGVTIPGQGEHNLLFVATEHDSVYAFNADGTNHYWKVSLLGSGETPSDNRGCSQVTPEIGITATPVIDRELGPNGTMFVVAMSKNGSGTYIQRLHALDLATGTDLVSAVTIAATYTGNGVTNLVFDPKQYKERPGLLLSSGVVYTAWSSHCDITPYQGWIMGYNEQTLTQINVLNIDPNVKYTINSELYGSKHDLTILRTYATVNKMGVTPPNSTIDPPIAVSDNVWPLTQYTACVNSGLQDTYSGIIPAGFVSTQDYVFPASCAVPSGTATIPIRSAGSASSTVWLAPSGATSLVAGATMTKAAGNATSIAVPSTAGSYKVYVVDPQGNRSAASTELLRVN